MKKRSTQKGVEGMRRRIGVLVLTVLLAMGMCACQADVLSEEMQQQIRQDYAEFFNENARDDITAEDVRIEEYFGTYTDGAIALFVTGENEGSLTVIVEEEIADCLFRFGSTQPLYIYHDSTFTPLKSAYDLGILTKEDVKQIHERFEKRYNEE